MLSDKHIHSRPCSNNLQNSLNYRHSEAPVIIIIIICAELPGLLRARRKKIRKLGTNLYAGGVYSAKVGTCDYKFRLVKCDRRSMTLIFIQ